MMVSHHGDDHEVELTKVDDVCSRKRRNWANGSHPRWLSQLHPRLVSILLTIHQHRSSYLGKLVAYHLVVSIVASWWINMNDASFSTMSQHVVSCFDDAVKVGNWGFTLTTSPHVPPELSWWRFLRCFAEERFMFEWCQHVWTELHNYRCLVIMVPDYTSHS